MWAEWAQQIFLGSVNFGGELFDDAQGVYVIPLPQALPQRRRQVAHLVKGIYPFLVQPGIDLPAAEFGLPHLGQLSGQLLQLQGLDINFSFQALLLHAQSPHLFHSRNKKSVCLCPLSFVGQQGHLPRLFVRDAAGLLHHFRQRGRLKLRVLL